MAAVAKPPPKRIGGLSGLPPKVQRRSKKTKQTTAAAVLQCCDNPDPQEEDGVKICKNCFTELSNVNITAEVTFEDQAGGRSTVQGGLVGENARFSKTLGAGAYRRIGGGERNSIAEIENAGRRALASLAAPLKVPDNITQQAASVWSLAALNNFMAGRKTDEVAAACMWAACRRQKDNDVLLMDMAEVLRINVFRLGEVYKDLCEKLFLVDKPVGYQHFIEMEPLIKKYCQKLQFGDKTNAVGYDALRIMKRMNRDWIVTGRHPAGLCGACIILAARMNNFQRSVREIVYVSKVADITIAKRVLEFRRTKSAALTVEEFREFGNRMTYQHDPPSVYESGYKQEKLKRKRAKRAEFIRDSIERLSQQPSVIDIPDNETDASSRLSSVAATSPAPSTVPVAEAETPAPQPVWQPTPPTTQPQPSQLESDAPIAINRKRAYEGSASDEATDLAKRQKTSEPLPNTADSSDSTAANSQIPNGVTQQPLRIDADGFAIPDLPIDPRLSDDQSSKPAKRGRRKKSDDPAPVQISAEELADENYLEDQINQMLDEGQVEDAMNEVQKVKEQERVEAEAERAKLTAAEQQRLEAAEAKRRREEEGFEFGTAPAGEMITAAELEEEFKNDIEVAHCLLSAAEVKTKEQIWLTHNEDWLRKQAEKEMLANVAKATGIPKGRGRKGKKKRGKIGDRSVLTDRDTPIESPADAAKAMLDKRAPLKSQHVDFATLERIYGRTSMTPSRDGGSQGGSQSPDEPEAGSVEPSEAVSEQPAAGIIGDGDGDAAQPGTNDTIPDHQAANAQDENDGHESNDEDVDPDEEDPEEADYRRALDMGQFNTATDEFGELPDDYGEEEDYDEYE